MPNRKSTRYRNTYNAENYERIYFFVPMGRKRLIEEHAKSLGIKSVNSYLNAIICSELGLTESEWKQKQ